MPVIYVKVDQAAAGTTLLMTPGAVQSVKVVGVVLSFDAPGTYKFTNGTVDLTGPLDVDKHQPPSQYFSVQPNVFFLETPPGTPLYLVTTTTTAHGFVAMVVERSRDFGADWLHVHMFDEEAGEIVHTCLNEAGIALVHPYVPLSSPDWRYDAGLRTEIHMMNGSIRYATEDFEGIRSAIGAKEIIAV